FCTNHYITVTATSVRLRHRSGHRYPRGIRLIFLSRRGRRLRDVKWAGCQFLRCQDVSHNSAGDKQLEALGLLPAGFLMMLGPAVASGYAASMDAGLSALDRPELIGSP
ncbi:unnamed protein product, partial [Clonostachys chloroleuca]